MYVLYVTVITCACQCDSIKKLDDDDDDDAPRQRVTTCPVGSSRGRTQLAIFDMYRSYAYLPDELSFMPSPDAIVTNDNNMHRYDKM